MHVDELVGGSLDELHTVGGECGVEAGELGRRGFVAEGEGQGGGTLFVAAAAAAGGYHSAQEGS